MLFVSTSPVSTQSSQYQNWKANKYSILLVTELGPPVSESQTRILKFYGPTGSEHKFHEIKIENWLPIRFNLGLSFWEPTVIYTVQCSTADREEF